MTNLGDKVHSFSIRDREVVTPGLTWVYVWRSAGPDNQIVRVGATWLHPAARAVKHLTNGDPGNVEVIAFVVPADVDRGRAKDLLVRAFMERGWVYLDPGGVQLGSTHVGKEVDTISSHETAFVDFVVGHLMTIETV